MSKTATKIDVTKALDSGNQFARKFCERLPGDQNVFFSPFNIRTALAMCFAGSDKDTQGAIGEVFNFDSNTPEFHASMQHLITDLCSPEDIIVNIANSLWINIDQPMEKSFLDLMVKTYEGGVNLADIEKNAEVVRSAINKWVEDKTNNKIKDLLKQLDPNTQLVIVSAIYFKAKWGVEFDPKLTEKRTFKTPGKEKKWDFMHREGEMSYGESDKLQRLTLSYKDERFTMNLFLPKEGVSLSEIEQDVETVDMFRQEVRAWIPKFKMTHQIDAGALLKHMGMGIAFSDDADFSRMSSDPLKIDKVIHKAFVEVNEEGTEAAAATAVTMVRCTSMPAPPKTFIADRPFIFTITHEPSQTILFMGRVWEPVNED